MSRVKKGTMARHRHKKVLNRAKGYFGRKSKLFKVANQAVTKSGENAYRDRRGKKRDFRRLWIARINAACRLNDISYSRFMYGLSQAEIVIDRKMLADLAVNDREAFAALVEKSKAAVRA